MKQELSELESKLKNNTIFHEKEHWRTILVKFLWSLIEG